MEAWGSLVDSHESLVVSEWCCELVYTVNGDFEREYYAKVKELGLEDLFIFTGALSDDEKWEAYARADLFVLPTYSENFGIVVAEALWAGVPVITTKGTPWKDLEGYKCGYWIDIGVRPLADALSRMVLLPDEERSDMGVRGHKLMEDRYSWDGIAKQLKSDYEELLK